MIRNLSKKEELIMEQNYYKLQDLIKNVSTLDESDEANESAKEALRNFYDVYSKLPPDKSYSTNQFHSEYMFYLIKIHTSLKKGDYVRAVNELSNMLYRNSMLYLQPRIYYNVIKVLEEYVIKK